MGKIERIGNLKLISLFALLIGLTVILLINLGSVHAPDCVGYKQCAEAMLKGIEWLLNVDIKSSLWQPLSTVQVIGYTALIVAFFVAAMLFVGQA